MKEMGGYLELDTYSGVEYHSDAIALNCGRNCLAYLLEAKNIKKIYLPYFLCASVKEVCVKYGVNYEYYSIDKTLKPIFTRTLNDDEWLFIVNYYGQFSNENILAWKSTFGNVIIDNAQAFFQFPCEGVDTIYTCRKFFGVPDGGYLSTGALLGHELQTDVSFERMRFLLGRYEKPAPEFYGEFVDNNKLFQNEPVKLMSKLTHNLLCGIDYEKIKKQRNENFTYLYNRLSGINALKLHIPVGAFAYPLLLKNGAEIRKKLLEYKIYVPTLWPDVFYVCKENDLEYQYAKNILPLPCDQRYGMEEMKFMCGFVTK